MRIPIEALELWRFASTDETRESIAAMQFASDGKEMVASATDGHRLGQVRWTAESRTGVEPFHLRGAEVKAALKRATKEERLAGAEYRDGALHFGRMALQVQELEDCQYPDVALVISPKGVKGDGATFGLDLGYLVDVLNWMKACGKESNRLQVTAPTTAHSPMRLDAMGEGPAALFIIMPMRLD